MFGKLGKGGFERGGGNWKGNWVVTHLLRKYPRHPLITMTQRIHGYAGREIKILPILYIPHITSLSLFEHWGWAHVCWDHVRKL